MRVDILLVEVVDLCVCVCVSVCVLGLGGRGYVYTISHIAAVAFLLCYIERVTLNRTA